MSETVLTLAGLGGRTGRGVRIAVIDSGVHAAHPHVGGVAGGAAFDDAGREGGDYIDRLGHGTAIAAVIHEKAPDASIYAIKVFDRELSATGAALVAAIRWATGAGTDFINLSLGTLNPEHEAALADAILEAHARGVVVVAAAPEPGRRWLPGALSGVVGVELDWDCPRDECRIRAEFNSVRVRASGFPRPAPGIPVAKNLKGLSFAVANVTGLLSLSPNRLRPAGWWV